MLTSISHYCHFSSTVLDVLGVHTSQERQPQIKEGVVLTAFPVHWKYKCLIKSEFSDWLVKVHVILRSFVSPQLLRTTSSQPHPPQPATPGAALPLRQGNGRIFVQRFESENTRIKSHT